MTPKQAGNISKSQRLLKIREIFDRLGKLNKEQIDQHVISYLGLEANQAIKRTLYRDLEDLVKEGFLSVTYFTRDMEEILDYDPSVHKNTVAHWVPIASTSKVLGGEYLEKIGCRFFCNDRLKHALKFSFGFVKVRDFEKGIYFQIGSDWVTLALDQNQFKLNLVIARINQDTGERGIIPPIETAFGKRTAVLLIPSPKVSSIKGESSLGHCRLEYQTSTEVFCEDLGAKNYTYYRPLTKEEYQDLTHSLVNQEAMTMTESSLNILEAVSYGDKLKPRAATKIETPTVISLSQSFKVLLS